MISIISFDAPPAQRAWLGGVLYESTGSYAIVWWLSIALGVFAALVNLPIVERQVARPAMA